MIDVEHTTLATGASSRHHGDAVRRSRWRDVFVRLGVLLTLGYGVVGFDGCRSYVRAKRLCEIDRSEVVAYYAGHMTELVALEQYSISHPLLWVVARSDSAIGIRLRGGELFTINRRTRDGDNIGMRHLASIGYNMDSIQALVHLMEMAEVSLLTNRPLPEAEDALRLLTMRIGRTRDSFLIGQTRYACHVSLARVYDEARAYDPVPYGEIQVGGWGAMDSWP